MKAQREKLFRKGNPEIRNSVYDDIRWLWVSAKIQGYDGSPEDYTDHMEDVLSRFHLIHVLIDDNADFASGRGPVGMVACFADDWSLTPHVNWMAWATPRNKLRCTVAYLMAKNYVKGLGSIKIFVSEHDKDYFAKLKKYLPISEVGVFVGGRSDGDEYIFHVRGRRRGKQHIRWKQKPDGLQNSPEATGNHATIARDAVDHIDEPRTEPSI